MIEISTHIPSEQKNNLGKMKLGMGTLEEHNYAHAPTIQPSTINHQHFPKFAR